jgi:hypothetical protein
MDGEEQRRVVKGIQSAVMPEAVTTSEQPSRPVVGVATHAFRFIDFDNHFNHLYCVARWAHRYDLVFIGKKGLHAAKARNMIVDIAIEHNCTHLLFMDADHIFPMSTLDLLMENKDEAVVSGLVCKKGENFCQVAYGKLKDGKYLPLDLELNGQVIEVAVAPFGCNLVNLKEVQRLQKPYFRDTCVDIDGSGTPTNLRSDVNFCDAIRAVGGRCWIDTRILVGHTWVEHAVYPQNAVQFNRLDKFLRDSTKLVEGEQGVYFNVYEGLKSG